MSRISTANSYQSALLNLMAAQTRQADAQTRIATQKNATDLGGFGRGSESLTALKAAQARVQGFVDAGEALAARFDAQDLALTRIDEAVGDARSAIANALASENAVTVLQDIGNQFQAVQGALNSKHQGDYLFAGSRTETAPVNVQTLAQLTAATDVASTFTNDDLAPTARVSESGPIKTGVLASDVGTDVFQIFRDIQAYSDDPATGPLSGKLTETQKTFLTTQLSRLDAAKLAVVNVTANNGALAKQVEATTASNAAQVTMLDGLVSKRTDADLAQAAVDLNLSEVAIQASAQVISRLSEVSLLNFLR